MGGVTHNFHDSKQQGDETEELLDSVFGEAFKITRFSSESVFDKTMQRRGVDRGFECRDTLGRKFLVEYKRDAESAKTGNYFIETLSVDNVGEPGWALKSLAQILITHVPNEKRVFIFDMVAIKIRVPRWLLRYGLVDADNAEYKTRGVAVPRQEMNQCLIKAVLVDDVGRYSASSLLDHGNANHAQQGDMFK